MSVCRSEGGEVGCSCALSTAGTIRTLFSSTHPMNSRRRSVERHAMPRGKECNVQACKHATCKMTKSSRTEPLHKPPADRAQWSASESVGPLTAGG